MSNEKQIHRGFRKGEMSAMASRSAVGETRVNTSKGLMKQVFEEIEERFSTKGTVPVNEVKLTRNEWEVIKVRLSSLEHNQLSLTAEKKEEMNVFSFRAEYQHDVDAVLESLTKKGIVYFVDINRQVVLENGVTVPDVEVQLRTDADESTLIRLANTQADCHVIAATIRQVPLTENSLERVRR